MPEGRLIPISPWRCECGHEERDLRAMRAHVCPGPARVPVVAFPKRIDRARLAPATEGEIGDDEEVAGE